MAEQQTESTLEKTEGFGEGETTIAKEPTPAETASMVDQVKELDTEKVKGTEIGLFAAKIKVVEYMLSETSKEQGLHPIRLGHRIVAFGGKIEKDYIPGIGVYESTYASDYYTFLSKAVKLAEEGEWSGDKRSQVSTSSQVIDSEIAKENYYHDELGKFSGDFEKQYDVFRDSAQNLGIDDEKIDALRNEAHAKAKNKIDYNSKPLFTTRDMLILDLALKGINKPQG